MVEQRVGRVAAREIYWCKLRLGRQNSLVHGASIRYS
jgi:hypothetical protein